MRWGAGWIKDRFLFTYFPTVLTTLAVVVLLVVVVVVVAVVAAVVVVIWLSHKLAARCS